MVSKEILAKVHICTSCSRPGKCKVRHNLVVECDKYSRKQPKESLTTLEGVLFIIWGIFAVVGIIIWYLWG